MSSLRFNTKIYKKSAIEEAIAAYSHLAKFKVKDNKDYIEVEISQITPHSNKILRDEFSNYVLGMTKKCL